MLSSTMRIPVTRKKPSVTTRHASEVNISLSSLPRRAVVVEAAAEAAPARKTEAVGRGARAPLQRTGAIGAINTDIGREIVKRGVTESAAGHEIEAATAGTPKAGKEVADTATQAASLPTSRAARRKAAAGDTEATAVGPPATAGRLTEAAVAMTDGEAAHLTHQREATKEEEANGAVQHAEVARLCIAAAVSTTGKSTVALFQVQHLVRAASPDHTLGADDINADDSRTLTARMAAHKTSNVRVARTPKSNKKPRARSGKKTSRRKRRARYPRW